MASSLLTSITSSPPSHQTTSQDEGGSHQVTIPIVQFSGCSSLHLGDCSVMHLCSLVVSHFSNCSLLMLAAMLTGCSVFIHSNS